MRRIVAVIGTALVSLAIAGTMSSSTIVADGSQPNNICCGQGR